MKHRPPAAPAMRPHALDAWLRRPAVLTAEPRLRTILRAGRPRERRPCFGSRRPDASFRRRLDDRC